MVVDIIRPPIRKKLFLPPAHKHTHTHIMPCRTGGFACATGYKCPSGAPHTRTHKHTHYAMQYTHSRTLTHSLSLFLSLSLTHSLTHTNTLAHNTHKHTKAHAYTDPTPIRPNATPLHLSSPKRNTSIRPNCSSKSNTAKRVHRNTSTPHPTPSSLTIQF